MAESITQRADELAGLAIFADCFGAELYGLATELAPLDVEAGDVLMRQGDPANFFLILAAGRVQIYHESDEGTTVTIEVDAGQIIGEIALLRNSRRVATVVADTEVIGWRGGLDAFADLIELPGVLPILVRTARQRMAAFITPIPISTIEGVELMLRPVLPGDSVRTASGHVEFSADTFYRRFMTARRPSKALMDYLFEVDYVDHFVWVVTDTEDNVVADARFVREEVDRSVAEIAFIVGDAYQHKGIGSFLMKALLVAGKVGGIKKFTARVLSENSAMRGILDDYGAVWERDEVGVVTTTLDLPDLATIELPKPLRMEIAGTARQVIRAVG